MAVGGALVSATTPCSAGVVAESGKDRGELLARGPPPAAWRVPRRPAGAAGRRGRGRRCRPRRTPPTFAPSTSCTSATSSSSVAANTRPLPTFAGLVSAPAELRSPAAPVSRGGILRGTRSWPGAPSRYPGPQPPGAWAAVDLCAHACGHDRRLGNRCERGLARLASRIQSQQAVRAGTPAPTEAAPCAPAAWSLRCAISLPPTNSSSRSDTGVRLTGDSQSLQSDSDAATPDQFTGRYGTRSQ